MPDDEAQRLDPDALLRAIEREQPGKGKLKIFFGMAAGVGKTYSMLKEARQKKQEGVDVVIGYLESHQRKEKRPGDHHLAGGINKRKIFGRVESALPKMNHHFSISAVSNFPVFP